MDAFLEMLPEGMLGHPDGIVFDTVEDAGKLSVIIRTGGQLPTAPSGRCGTPSPQWPRKGTT